MLKEISRRIDPKCTGPCQLLGVALFHVAAATLVVWALAGAI